MCVVAQVMLVWVGVYRAIVTATKCAVTSRLGRVTCVVELPCWCGYYPGNKALSCTEEVVPALEYVLKPTYSLQWKRRRERGQVLLSGRETRDSTCHPKDNKDHYLYYREQ